MRMRLSASQVVARDNCARMHWYQSVAKVRPRSTSSNIVLGNCIDWATRNYLEALALGHRLPDPVADFNELWRETRQNTEISYSATQSPELVERMGTDLLKVLPSAWDATGFQIAMDQAGTPMIDFRLSASLGKELGIELELDGVLDLVAYTREGSLGPLDVKSSAVVHSELYTSRSDQLTTYQILLDANRDALGIGSVDVVGFWDFLKRKASSRIEAPIMVPRRPAAEIAEYRQKLFWMADDIRRRRFPKVSRMQFNTPCEMCDFAQHCVSGDSEGLIFPSQAKQQSA